MSQSDMKDELRDLVAFLHHGNSQIRQIASENLVGFSTTQHAIFKTDQLLPIKDLKVLVRDYAPIAKSALTILVNLSDDPQILAELAPDDELVESLLQRITDVKESNANEIAMLLSNLAKSDSTKRIINITRAIPKGGLSTSKNAMDQLMDCFVKGAGGNHNKNADFDYLAYFFADIAKHPEGRKYFVSPQGHDNNIIPLTKLTVFTEHASDIRRRGVASTIKNVSFDIESHPRLISSDSINLLPYILLPLMGSEEYTDEDTEGMLDDLQLLPPDKEREKDLEILKTHLETLLLLTTTRNGRDVLRQIKLYPIIREAHLQIEDDDVREACDRIVQVLMRDEEDEMTGKRAEGFVDVEDEDDDEDKVIDIL
ncbi:DUF383-domain-containing protein [Tothia fuscella]|uniref:Protein HGH1 homolog n=1 Tax=Tothia fuscella TaxID=1048955 RepID=A0A9P4TZ01_9PEZI|nr:DUF383-domain-containing protein [Tothia fuscella]